MTDRRSREKSLHELEFNDLNIHLYLTLNYGTASEHLDFDSMVLYNAFVLSWGLTITQNSIRRISDLDRSGLTDTRSAENDRIGADTDPEYRIDASLILGAWIFWNQVPECIYLKTTPLRFRMYSQYVYFVKQSRHHPTSHPQTPLRHVTATTTWTNTERLSFTNINTDW